MGGGNLTTGNGPASHYWTAAEDQKMLAMRDIGHTSIEISLALPGRSRKSVTQRLHRLDHPENPNDPMSGRRYQNLTPKVRQERHDREMARLAYAGSQDWPKVETSMAEALRDKRYDDVPPSERRAKGDGHYVIIVRGRLPSLRGATASLYGCAAAMCVGG